MFHKEKHPKYEQLNTLRDQNKNTRVVVYRRYTSTFHTSMHLVKKYGFYYIFLPASAGNAGKHVTSGLVGVTL